MTNIAALKERNAQRWAAMHIHGNRLAEFDAAAREYCKPENKVRFQAVTRRLVALGYQAVPWWFIAVVAEREYGRHDDGSLRWDRQLGQGDPLHQVSRHEPAGRGPFLDHPNDNIDDNAWLRCCLDALINCAPFAAKWTDWSVGGTLTIWEEYNGLGYAMRGVPSAYVWSGTDQYVSGKFVADHDYRSGVVDVQEGCAPLLARMMAIDSSIVFGAKSTQPKEKPAVDTTQTTTQTTLPTQQPHFHLSFDKIEATVETIAHFLPFITGFLPPQLKPIVAGVPVLEGVLKAADDIQKVVEGGGGADQIKGAIAARLHEMGNNVGALIENPTATAQALPHLAALLRQAGIGVPPTQAGQQASTGG